MILPAEEEALLSQGDDDKGKSAEKSPRKAAWVRLPSPLSYLETKCLSSMEAYKKQVFDIYSGMN